MFCPNCGTEVNKEAAYCPRCGKKLATAHMESSETTEPQLETRTVRYVSRDILRLVMLEETIKRITAVAAVVLLAVLVVKSYRPTIHMSDYLVFRCEGYDSVGRVTVDLNTWDLLQKGTRKLRVDEKALTQMESGTDIQPELKRLLTDTKSAAGDSSGENTEQIFISQLFDPQNREWNQLSNGDQITFHWKVDENVKSALEKIYHCKIDLSEKEFTVDGLKEAEKYDAFQDYSVSYEGIAPEGKLIMETSRTDEQGREVQYSADKEEHLSNGDQIVITVTSDDEKDVKQYGSVVSPKTKTFIVEGLDTYLSSASEISEQELNDRISQEKDELLDGIANDEISKEDINIEYIGYYFYRINDSQQYDREGQIYNKFYILYKVPAVSQTGSTVFIISSHENIERKADHTLYFGQESLNLTDSLSRFYSDYGQQGEYFTIEDHIDKKSDLNMNYAPSGPNKESEWWYSEDDETKADKALSKAVKDEACAEYGVVHNTDMESPYWYHDWLHTGDFSGEEGVFAWELQDLDKDGQNELIVYYRKEEYAPFKYDYHGDGRDVYTNTVHGWRFGFAVYEFRNGKVTKTAEQEICNINVNAENDNLLDEFKLGYPEYFGLSVALKDTAYGKEVIVLQYIAALGSNWGQSGAPFKIAGYCYDGDIYKTGYFEPATYYLDTELDWSDTSGVIAIGVQPENIDMENLFGEQEEWEGDAPFEPLEEMLLAKPVFHIYRTDNLDNLMTQSGRDIWTLRGEDGNEDLDLSECKNILHTKILSASVPD